MLNWPVDSIRASILEGLSGNPGNKAYPGKSNLKLSGHPGKRHLERPSALSGQLDVSGRHNLVRRCIRLSGQFAVSGQSSENSIMERLPLWRCRMQWLSGQLLYPGNRFYPSKNLYPGTPGRLVYLGTRATFSIREPGQKLHPGIRAIMCIRATMLCLSGQRSYSGAGQKFVSGQQCGYPGKTVSRP